MKTFSLRRTSFSSALFPAIRRSVFFQICCTTGFETVFVLGVLSTQKLNGSNLLFGLSPTTLFALGQLLMALPAGRLMDRIGRKPVLVSGAFVEAFGLALTGVMLQTGIPLGVEAGLFLLGLGSGAAQLVYLIGGDLYPPHRRAEGLSFMTTFSSIGVVGGPYLVGLVGDTASWLGLDSIVTPWYFGAGLVALAGWVMLGLHPEPLDVARAPEKYFPAQELLRAPADEMATGRQRALVELLRLYPVLAAMGILICFQGLRMSIIPLITYVLNARGFSLTLGATMVAAIGFGMILGSYPSGRLGDRLGRKIPLFLAAGVGLVCAFVIPRTYSLWLMFVTLVLLGAAFVTTLNMTRTTLADSTTPYERGTVMSASMFANGIAVIVFPTLATYVLGEWGWETITWLGAGLILLICVLVFFMRDKRTNRVELGAL